MAQTENEITGFTQVTQQMPSFTNVRQQIKNTITRNKCVNDNYHSKNGEAEGII